MLMLAPFFGVVTVLVLQSCVPVAASRHTSSPEDLAPKMYPPCITGLDVLLSMRFEGARFSGQRKLAAGGSPPSSSIRPLTSNRLPWKTGVAVESLLLVTMGCRQKVCPLAGSRDAMELPLQTINCRLPAEVMAMGELLETCSSSTFQTSFPVCLSKARTLAPGFAPVNTISSEPSSKGEGRQDISATSYSCPMFFSQITDPAFASRQCT